MIASGPALRLTGVSRRFGSVIAVDDVHLELRRGEVLALLGPSGCGKTTCLRLMAGFERPDAGTVEIDGRVVASPAVMVPPERRRIGLVFQDLALFPHLDVRSNVGYGIRKDAGRDLRVDELLELVGLASETRRLPHELSGGMQQRVALARALAPRPDVLLLDEPFTSLDQAMRTQLRSDVRAILRDARQSAIFVTHDQAEALTIADRVAVMARGRLLQSATPELIYAEPATPFVATFIGVANLVRADVADGVARTRFGPVSLVGPDAPGMSGPGLCLLRPEHFTLEEAPGRDGGRDSWDGIDRRFSGSEILLEVRAEDGDRIWVEAGDQVRHVGPGDRVALRLRHVESVAFPRTHAEAPAAPPRPAERRA